MAGIKRTPADDAFSKCVRERSDWCCESCGTSYKHNPRGLDCSHYFGRRAHGVRFDPDNAFSHCTSCHFNFSANPDDFRHWALEKLGEGRIQMLREKREDIGLAKMIKKNLKDVAKHYREEHKRMKKERDLGATGRVEFENFT